MRCLRLDWFRSVLWGAIGAALLVGAPQAVVAAELLVGAAKIEITPPRPVALAGQFHTRISKSVETPLLAVAVALESREGEKVLDQAILVACDLVAIRSGVQAALRQQAEPRLKGFDIRKLFLSATHTHTGPVTTESNYKIPKQDVMQLDEYREFLTQKLSDLIVQAWESRKPGGVSWTLGHAVVGYNRRAVYADGAARMYGPTNVADFRGMEGYEDHAVEMLYFWDRDQKLLAVAVNLACPSQEVEGRSTVNADFWHEARQRICQQISPDVCVLGWASPCGDQSPHIQWRKAAEERMRRLRGLSSVEEIGRRIALAVADTYPLAKRDIHTDAPLVHRVLDVSLPPWKISDKEYRKAKESYEGLQKKAKLTENQETTMRREKRVMERYEKADQQEPYTMELHAIRLGDVAIATNPFELYLDYGVQIKARSPAEQTFLIQLACDSAGYLPTERAVQGGGYSAIPHGSPTGPEGGRVLVDRTVEAIESLWPKEKP